MTTSDTPAAADLALSTTPAVTPAAAGIALSVDAPAGPTVVSTNAAVVPPPVTSITPSELQVQLASLRTAYNSGADTVTYEGKTVHYRDASEMRAAIAAIENQLNGMTGANTPRTILVRSRKGW